MAEGVTQEEAQVAQESSVDDALMKGASMEDINNIRARAGQPQAEVIAQSEGYVDNAAPIKEGAGFAPVERGFAPSVEEEQLPEFQWMSGAAWEHVQKLQTATGITDEEKQTIYNDLVINGSSTRALELWQSIEAEEKMASVEGVASVVDEIGVDNAATRVQERMSIDNEYAVDDAALAAVVAKAKDPITVMEMWEKEIDTREEFKREYAEALEHTPFTFSDIAQGAEAMLAPFVPQQDLAQLGEMLKKKFGAPADSAAYSFILQGNYLNTIRDWITDLPKETQIDVLRAVVETSDETSGLFTDNDFLKKDMIRQLFAGATGDFVAGDLEVDKFINNAVSLMDLTIVGGVAKGAVKLIAGSKRSSSLATVTRVDPKQGEALTAASIADATGSTAEALGTTRSDAVVDALLPKWKGYAEDPLVDDKLITRQVDLLNDIKGRTVDISVHLKKAEKLKQRNALIESLQNAAPLRAKLNRASSNVTDTGMEVEAVYTYNNFPAAKAAIERLHPEARVVQEGEDTMRVFIKNDYKVDESVTFDSEDIYGRGSKAIYLGDVSSNLAPALSDSFYVAFDASRGHEHLFLEMIEPFTKASNKNKGIVIDILDRTRVMNTDVSIAEIRDMLPTGISSKDAQEVLESVVSVRTMTDASYVVENKVFRERQIALNRRYVKNGDFGAMATPASMEQAKNMKVAYDPATQKMIKLNPEAVSKLYEEGGQIAVSGATHGADSAVQTRYLLVSGETSLEELPQQVLKYDSNYLTTLYKDQYFITQKKGKLTLDGDVVPSHAIGTKVINTAKSRKEAEAALEELRVTNPDIEYDFKHSRSLTAAQTAESYESLRRSTGGLFFSPKGERLKDTMGNLADIEDPVASIRTQAASVSRLVSMRPIVDLMKKRFVNKYPQFSKEGFPTSKGALVNPTKLNDDAAQEAKVMWDYINMVENGSVSGQKWQNAMIGFGEWLEDVTGSAKLGSFVRTTVGARDPLSRIRGATFMATIVLNPARQLLIQSQQYLFLAGIDPAYVLTGAVHRRGGSLLLASLGDSKITNKAGARMAGMSETEFKNARQAFKESGLTESIDSHLLGRDAMVEIDNEVTKSVIGAAGQAGKNVVKGAVQAAKSVGFDLGERINISNTYMLAWKRHRDKFPTADMTTNKAKTAVAADARQLALGMTKAGAFGYQDGFLSTATQFFSIQHKATLAMMRGIPGLSKYGNKAITPREGRRILYFQAGIFGGAGWGINAALDNALDAAGVTELSQTDRQILHGGALDLVMNTMISSMAGEDTDFAFAANMSAGQGFTTSLLQYMEDIASGDVGVLELMAGASSSVGSRFGTALTTLKSILGSPQELTEERAKLVFNDFASLASGYRQYLNSKTMTNLGQWVDKNRNLLPLAATSTEAVVYGMVGIPKREVEAMYHVFNSRKDSKDRIDGIAQEAFGRISRVIGESATERDRGIVGLRAMQEFVDTEAHVLQALLGGESADYYAVYSKVQALLKQRTGKDVNGLLADLHTAVINNTYGGDLASMLDFFERNTNADKEQIDTIRNVFEKAVNGGAK